MILRRALLAILLLSPFTAAPAHAASPLQREQVRVTSVFDGDTIQVERGGRLITVRLIGVDTPETSRPGRPVEFYGPEAAEFARRSLEGRMVQLEFEPPDRQGGSVDKYGRALAYVIIDGRNFDLELVRRGYGKVYALYPFTYEREFQKAERSARAARLGLWNEKHRAAWLDPARRGRIIGNIRSHIYHLPGQDDYTKVLEKNRIYFQNEEEAVKAGFRKARDFAGNRERSGEKRQE